MFSAAETQPPRTWRPMVAWTAGVLALLGVVWFVTSICVSLRRAHYRAQTVATAEDGEELIDGEEAIRQLGGKERAAQYLALYLRWPDRLSPYRGQKERHNAMAILSRCGVAGVPPLIRILTEEDAPVDRRYPFWKNHYFAALELGRIGPDAAAAVPVLTKALASDPNPSVRAAAAEALKKIRGEEPPK